MKSNCSKVKGKGDSTKVEIAWQRTKGKHKGHSSMAQGKGANAKVTVADKLTIFVGLSTVVVVVNVFTKKRNKYVCKEIVLKKIVFREFCLSY